MAFGDVEVLALTLWRENRGGGYIGMQSVANVVINRVRARSTSAYEECVRKLQFSSLTAPGDSQLVLYPAVNDQQWGIAQGIAQAAVDGTLADLTGGATLYYNPSGISPTNQTFTLPNGSQVPFPQGWNLAAVKYVCTIASHLFFIQT